MGAMATILAYAAAALVALWRVAHAIPTRQVLAGFVPITPDNRRVILQEWLAEAFTMWGIAAVVVTVTIVAGAGADAGQWVSRAAAVLLLALAVLTSPYRCPNAGHLVQDLPSVDDNLCRPAGDSQFVVVIEGRV